MIPVIILGVLLYTFIDGILPVLQQHPAPMSDPTSRSGERAVVLIIGGAILGLGLDLLRVLLFPVGTFAVGYGLRRYDRRGQARNIAIGFVLGVVSSMSASFLIAPFLTAQSSPTPTVSSISRTVGGLLGTRWEDRVLDWTGVWTRRGESNVFDAVFTDPDVGRVTAVLTVNIDGRYVTAQRRQDSTGNDCDYMGLIAPDGRTVEGASKCIQVEELLRWNATIYR
jgi:hypothetical protein